MIRVKGREQRGPSKPQGGFNLPREFRRPFFLAAYLATLAVAAYYGLYWVDNIAEPKHSEFTIATDGAKMAPGFFAIVLLAGMLLSLLYPST